MKRIFIADYDTSFISQLIVELNHFKDIEIIGCAHNGYELLMMAGSLTNSDILISNLFLSGVSGVEAIQLIRMKNNLVKIIAHSSIFENYMYNILKLSRANVYTPKNPHDICKGVRHLFKEDYQFESTLTFEWNNNIEVCPIPSRETKIHLSPKDKMLMFLVCEGKNSKEISDKMNLSARTIEYYTQSLLLKLNLKNKVDLVRYGYANGLCTVSCPRSLDKSCNRSCIF